AADQIADDDETGREPEANLQFELRRGGGRVPGGGDLKRGAHGSFGIILMRRRMAEQDQHAIADITADGATVFADDRGDAVALFRDDLAQVFRIELCRERRRADEITEHHRELAALRARTGSG